APRTAAGTAMILQQGREAFSGLVKNLGYQYSAPLNFYWRLWQHYVPPGMRVPLKRVLGRGMETPAQPTPPLFDNYAPFGTPPAQGMNGPGLPPGGGLGGAPPVSPGTGG